MKKLLLQRRETMICPWFFGFRFHVGMGRGFSFMNFKACALWDDGEMLNDIKYGKLGWMDSFWLQAGKALCLARQARWAGAEIRNTIREGRKGREGKGREEGKEGRKEGRKEKERELPLWYYANVLSVLTSSAYIVWKLSISLLLHKRQSHRSLDVLIGFVEKRTCLLVWFTTMYVTLSELIA